MEPNASKKKSAKTPVDQPPPARVIVFYVVCAIVCAGLDLGSKEWALSTLSKERSTPAGAVCVPDVSGYAPMQRERLPAQVLIPNYLEFRYAENCGAAFGALRDSSRAVRHGLFSVAGLIAISVLTFMVVKGRGGTLFFAGAPLVVAGAVGNLADRFRHGFVVDFVRFHLEERWEYPTFNVADVFIVVGVALMMLDGFREPARKPARRDTDAPDKASAESAKG